MTVATAFVLVSTGRVYWDDVWTRYAQHSDRARKVKVCFERTPADEQDPVGLSVDARSGPDVAEVGSGSFFT